MNLIEVLKVAVAAIWAHKLRSALTLLGMIVGVTAFVTVVSLIQGFNVYIDEKIAGIGAKSFSVQRFNPFEDFKDTDTIAAAQRRNKELTLDDYQYIKDHATLIGKIGAKARGTPSQVKRNDQLLDDVNVMGATANTADIDNRNIANGRFFTDPENDGGARVAYVGADIATKLFPGGDPIGGEISIRGLPYRVIGVEEVKGTVFGIPQDSFIVIPLKTYSIDFGGLVRQRSLYFTATSKTDDVFNDAVDEARFLMRARHRLAPGEKDNFGIVTPDAITGLRDRLFGTIFLVAIFVPGIALIVGAIVIMNIMLVSVTERTKEIGLRKSLGARRGDILKQFLFEAITLATIGGAVGIFLAWVVGKIVTATFFPTYLSILAVLGALAASGGVGILSGIVPAWKAARLDPIEALRADG
ncbi:MAG: putative transport system permease protein [Blastocatellia bacterium]|jgi:putative ABC transport system permease protein|nr:putative transport system permease protein [Blastocatellia bacterium]MDX6497332.1 putative transport system permease protein [Blastocatellia bacterium]